MKMKNTGDVVDKEGMNNECSRSNRKIPFKRGDDTQFSIDEWRRVKVQSPIAFKHDQVLHYTHFQPLEFHGHWDLGGKAVIKNTGSTVKLWFEDRKLLPIMKGGPLTENYIFEHAHYHWSNNKDYRGCEHVFEGKHFPMEVHVVYFNAKYGTFQEARRKEDGLSVIAYFHKVKDDIIDNANFNKVCKGLPSIIYSHSKCYVESDCLLWLKEASTSKGYYTYQGSVTTKPFSANVTWIIFPMHIQISMKQMLYFKNLNMNHSRKDVKIQRNIRDLQVPSKQKKLYILYVDK